MTYQGKEQFFAFKPRILEFIDKIALKWPVKEQSSHFHDLVDYTIDGGKCTRGLMSVYGFLELTGLDPNSEEAAPGYALGWAQEILQASFLVADDLMDKSELRRGKPCWYRTQERKYVSVSDSYFLENVIYMIIDEFFKEYPLEVIADIKSLLHETTIRTSIGQFIDMSPKEPTIENWELTVTSKTAYYSVWQPFVSGIVASNKVPREVWDSPELFKALMHAGVLFQCQDDRIDLYGNKAKTGKIGTDIPDGKASWLFVKALELANEEQKKILKENVGHPEQEKIQKVIDVYNQLGMDKVSWDAAFKSYEELKVLFTKVDPRVPKGLINYVLDFLNCREF